MVSNVVAQLHSKHNYKNIVGLGSSFGKDVIPRLAGKYVSQPITDIVEVHDEKTFVRPTYAGNALTKVKTSQDVNFLTFRPSSFEEIAPGKNEAPLEVISEPAEKLSEFVKEEKSDSNKPDLTTARIVVSGGRGVKSK
jgi:electron transfer flavoprotein alpha subunit